MAVKSPTTAAASSAPSSAPPPGGRHVPCQKSAPAGGQREEGVGKGVERGGGGTAGGLEEGRACPTARPARPPAHRPPRTRNQVRRTQGLHSQTVRPCRCGGGAVQPAQAGVQTVEGRKRLGQRRRRRHVATRGRLVGGQQGWGGRHGGAQMGAAGRSGSPRALRPALRPGRGRRSPEQRNGHPRCAPARLPTPQPPVTFIPHRGAAAGLEVVPHSGEEPQPGGPDGARGAAARQAAAKARRCG